MNQTRENIIINRSAQEVFDFTINPENTPKWVKGVEHEEANEYPTRVGTIYKSRGVDGDWIELEITAFENGVMFEMKKIGDNHYVRYTFTPLTNKSCSLEYLVWVADGEISERFSRENIIRILKDLKCFLEKQPLSL